MFPFDISRLDCAPPSSGASKRFGIRNILKMPIARNMWCFTDGGSCPHEPISPEGLPVIIVALLCVMVFPAWWAVTRRNNDPDRKTRLWAFCGGLLLLALAGGHYADEWFADDTSLVSQSALSLSPIHVELPAPPKRFQISSLVYLVGFIGAPWLAAWGLVGKASAQSSAESENTTASHALAGGRFRTKV